MKLLGSLLRSATMYRSGKLVIELVEGGTEVTMVRLISMSTSLKESVTDLLCLIQEPARHANKDSSRCATMQQSMAKPKAVDVCCHSHNPFE